MLSEDIGLRVDFVDSSPDDLSDENVRLLFPSGSRLWKADIGPLRPNCAVAWLKVQFFLFHQFYFIYHSAVWTTAGET